MRRPSASLCRSGIQGYTRTCAPPPSQRISYFFSAMYQGLEGYQEAKQSKAKSCTLSRPSTPLPYCPIARVPAVPGSSAARCVNGRFEIKKKYVVEAGSSLRASAGGTAWRQCLVNCLYSRCIASSHPTVIVQRREAKRWVSDSEVWCYYYTTLSGFVTVTSARGTGGEASAETCVIVPCANGSTVLSLSSGDCVMVE